MVPTQIEHEVVVAAPVERVWSIITEAEHIRQWFAFDGATLDLRPGGQMVMTWKEHGVFYARIEEVAPPHRFAYRGAYRAEEQPGDGNATLVEFTLTPVDGGTLVRVVESGFHDLALSEAEQAVWAAVNAQGWSGAFTMLDAYLARQAA